MASLLARTVAFTGHRPRYFSFSGGNDPHLLALRRTLREQILRLHRENGATHFLTGMALGVDTWAAQEVLALKEQGMRLKDAAKEVAEHTGLSKNELYAAALEQ